MIPNTSGNTTGAEQTTGTSRKPVDNVMETMSRSGSTDTATWRLRILLAVTDFSNAT